MPHQVIREHLESFLCAAAEAGEGAGLPRFVEREFREVLTCGAFEGGFARFQCEGCAVSTWCHVPVRDAGSVRVAAAAG